MICSRTTIIGKSCVALFEFVLADSETCVDNGVECVM